MYDADPETLLSRTFELILSDPKKLIYSESLNTA